MTTTPPAITTLPAAPDPNNRTTFNALAYPWSAALPTFGTQVSAVAANVKANADEAATSATQALSIYGNTAAVNAAVSSAASSAATATTQAGLSTTNGAAQVSLAAAQVALATTQANNATANGAAQVGLAAAQVALATTQANNAAAQVALATTQANNAASSASTALTQASNSAASASQALAIYGDTAAVSSAVASAAASATTAATQAGLATTNGAAQVTLATAQAGIAATKAGEASASAIAAAASVASIAGGPVASVNGLTGVVVLPSAQACDIKEQLLAMPVSSNHAVSRLVPIDSTRSLLVFASTLGISAVCYNKSTNTYGTAVLVRSFSAGGSVHAFLSSSDKVLVSTCNDSNAFEAVILSITGSAISVGTAVTKTLALASTIRHGVQVGSAFVVTHVTTSTTNALAITVSGTTPTIGSELTISGSSGNGGTLALVNTSTCLFIGAIGTVTAAPISVSGTALTLGTSATATGDAVYGWSTLTSGRFAIVYRNTQSFGAIVSVSGTVATMSTVQLGTAASLQTFGHCIGNQVIVPTHTASYNVLSDVSGVATAGTPVVASTEAIARQPSGYGTDYAAWLITTATSTMYVVLKISGLNPVVHRATTIANTSISAGLTGASVSPPNEPPQGVLSNGSDSVRVFSSPDGISGKSLAMKFSASSVSLLQMPHASQTFVRESETVIFSAATNASSLNLPIVRLELV